jgi:diguanylate cyclase (GGDEF)-like protein
MKKQIGFSKQIMLILISLSIICTSLMGFIGYSVTNKLNNDLVMENLQVLTDSTYNLIDSAVNASIKNNLRAIAEANKNIMEMYYNRYKASELTENEAKDAVERILLSQPVGDTGYIYVVDSKGVLKVHPQLKGADLSSYLFIREQIKRKVGYMEYTWKNPSDQEEREKALYMTYFDKWDAIISVSSYKSEFVKLVNVLDFKNNIFSNLIGESGYMYVINSKGKLIIHPKLEGANIYDSVDSRGNYFVKEIIREKNGTIIYPWKNPGEAQAREKIVTYKYYKPMDWYLCSGVYIDELVKPLEVMKKRLLLATMFILLLAVLISMVYAKVILNPIKRLIEATERVIAGNLDVRIETTRRDEIGRLTNIFNEMVTKIKNYMENLNVTNLKLEEINISLEQKVTERTRQLEILSNLDGLTGIANRRKMDEYLEHEWDVAIRQKFSLSLVILDIDFFKNYNDTFGHPMGDECLKKVAGTISGSLHRVSDFAARYGGEEFVAILSNTDKSGAYKTAERIRKDIENLHIPHTSSKVSGYVTVSLGVSTLLNFSNRSLNDFVRSADEALYKAKQAGRNRTVTVEY